MKVTGSTIQQLEKGKSRSRCRKWRLWATTEQGRKSRRFEGTYTAASDALCAWVSELEGIVPNAETFAAYAESWRLWREKSGDIASGTAVIDRSRVHTLVRSPIGSMRMEEITPEACRDALMWIRENPERADRLSNTTMRGVHTYLSMIMAQAADDGRVASNPMERIKRPKTDTEEREALSPGELQLFLNRVDALPLDGRAMALYFMACLGLRRGEACALLDGDVADGLCRVHASVIAHSGEVGETKTDAGTRSLPVPPKLAAKVDEWREERRRVGWHGVPWMCCNAAGAMLQPKALYAWWMSVRDGLGCGGMTLHQLRHSNLSMVARYMSPFDLQGYAGWSSLAPAMTYIHEDMDSVSRAVKNAWECIGLESNAPKTHHFGDSGNF